MTPIPITADEIAAACNALRYQAVHTTVANAHRQREIDDLCLLAQRLENRYSAAANAAIETGEDE